MLASSTNRTPFTAYLANGGARQSQWAMHEGNPSSHQDQRPDEPTYSDSLPQGEASNNHPTQSPSRSREDSEFESSEPEDASGASRPSRGQAMTTPGLHHPVAERCRNHALRHCHATSCNRWHGKSNPQGAACRDHGTPGIWCERVYEVSGPGCPYSHEESSNGKSHSPERQRPRNAPPDRFNRRRRPAGTTCEQEVAEKARAATICTPVVL